MTPITGHVCVLLLLFNAVIGDSEINGILQIDEDKLRTVGSPKAQREAICRYLCGKGPVIAHKCFCKVSVQCMDSFCPKGKYCKKVGGGDDKTYACCPSKKVKPPKECTTIPRVRQIKSILKYYRYNAFNRMCEPAYLFTKKARIRKVPGYKSAQMCKICTLFSFCDQEESTSRHILETIFNFQGNAFE